MADRYWVGGSAAWDSTAGTKWATTSGGAGGASVPAYGVDDVYFDANSGAGTVSYAGTGGQPVNLDFTGFTGTFAFGAWGIVTVYGSLTFASGMTITGVSYFNMVATGGARTITFAGKSIYQLRMGYAGSTATWTLQDDAILTSAGLLLEDGGTFDANDNNVTASFFYAETGTVHLGDGTWTMTVGYFKVEPAVTLHAEGSTIINTANPSGNFYGGGKTYNSVSVKSGNTVYGSNTFSTLTLQRSGTIEFEGGTTQTVTTLSCAVSGTNVCTLRSSSTTNATISKAGGGTVQLYYMNVDYITGDPVSTWYMGNDVSSVNGSNNSQLYFTSPAIVDPANAYADDASYATAVNTDGVVYVELSKDAGTTWTVMKNKTFTSSESTETYGTGASELWGVTFTGDDIDNTSFKLRVKGVQFQEIYKTFGFTVGAAQILSGVEVAIKAKYSGGTVSINHIKVKAYYDDSSTPLQTGSTALATDGRKAGEGAGAGTGVLCFYDGSNWIAVDTGATVAA